MKFEYYVYILCNAKKTVLYVGVTNNLGRRMMEHRQGLAEGFTKKYNVNKLIYAETYSDVTEAISREKQIKHWARKKKEALINAANPDWEEIEIL